jgi:hypothetical protein
VGQIDHARSLYPRSVKPSENTPGTRGKAHHAKVPYNMVLGYICGRSL